MSIGNEKMFSNNHWFIDTVNEMMYNFNIKKYILMEHFLLFFVYINVNNLRLWKGETYEKNNPVDSLSCFAFDFMQNVCYRYAKSK